MEEVVDQLQRKKYIISCDGISSWSAAMQEVDHKLQ